ncbi:unnamed protein product [Paramecium primaurelia]|uniref:Major facilitator superfamily protein n=1 Tax=Paramecium primaurelia TaxID=5886 RepID=A0A8S1PPX5_PARPR|nr:unnamed protein product [Paramecium primaurelia]
MWKGFLSIFGGFLTHLVTGAFYFWGNISMNVSSYYRFNGYPDIETKTVSAVFPAIYFGIAIGSQFGIHLARRFGHKLISVVNMLCYCASMYAATYSNFYFFVFFQGLLPGVFIGIEYLIPVDNALKFFPSKKGMVTGLILCGFGFTPLVFNPILQKLLNPDNILPVNGYYPEDVAENLMKSLRIVTTIYLVLGLIGAFLMQSINQSDDHDDETYKQKLIQNDAQVSVNSQFDILKKKEFWLSTFQVFCLTGFGFILISHYKEYGIVHIPDDQFFSLVGMIGGFTNGLSRFLWSFLLDFINYKYLVFINIVMAMILAATINLIADSKFLFMLWVILTYLQYGGLYTLFPGICTKQFGTKFGPLAYNMAFNSIPFSNLTQFLLTLYFHDQFMNGQLFYIYVGINFLALIIQVYLLINEGQRKRLSSVNYTE